MCVYMGGGFTFSGRGVTGGSQKGASKRVHKREVHVNHVYPLATAWVTTFKPQVEKSFGTVTLSTSIPDTFLFIDKMTSQLADAVSTLWYVVCPHLLTSQTSHHRPCCSFPSGRFE